MAEPALSWKDCCLAAGPDASVQIPDFELLQGRSALAFHPHSDVLRGLVARCSAVELSGPGNFFWQGRAAPKCGRLGARLDLFGSIALVDSRSQFFYGRSLIENMCLDMEYNQGLFNREASRLAMELLNLLGLSDLAQIEAAELVGPERGLGLMAMAISRKPRLFILDRPIGLIGRNGFQTAWNVIKDELALGGSAALVLDYAPEGAYVQNDIDDVIDLGSRNFTDGGQSP
ncbi:MAG: hypothetical protein LBT47_12870 [Deltaproteobacteria bacterium]|jgi:hypothetical protein|nr:hypothetical protein [Deltaproteobacteria bacterium]